MEKHTIDRQREVFAYMKALDQLIKAMDTTVERFIEYDCDHNILTREKFQALLKLHRAISEADIELI